MSRTKNPADYRPRLPVPAHLTKLEAKLFKTVVASVSADHFQECDQALIVEYVRAVLLADQAAAALADGGVIIEGKASPWLTAQEKAQRALVALSMRLRLAPQSRFDRTTAGTSARTGLPNLGDDDDDDDLLAKPMKPLTGLASFRR